MNEQTRLSYPTLMVVFFASASAKITINKIERETLTSIIFIALDCIQLWYFRGKRVTHTMINEHKHMKK